MMALMMVMMTAYSVAQSMEQAIYSFSSASLDGEVSWKKVTVLLARNGDVLVGVSAWTGGDYTEVVVMGEELLDVAFG